MNINNELLIALKIIQEEFELKDLNEVIVLLLYVAGAYYDEYGTSWQDNTFRRYIKSGDLYKKYFGDD